MLCFANISLTMKFTTYKIHVYSTRRSLHRLQVLLTLEDVSLVSNDLPDYSRAPHGVQHILNVHNNLYLSRSRHP